MDDDVIRPKDSMVVVVTLKSKMATRNTSSGGGGEMVKVRSIWPIWKLKKSPEPLLDGPATSEHMSAFLPFKFPASGKYDAILD